MLYRSESSGTVVITQPAHAWLSGQLARAWGRGPFAAVPEEVRLAAEQHDLGFHEWEQAPTFNPETHLPHSFLEMPCKLHLDLWVKGVASMLAFGRLPALLVSMHFTNIARQKWIGSSEHQAEVNAYLEQQETFESALRTSICNDHFYGPYCNGDTIENFQKLVSIWDWISLLLCLRLLEKRVVTPVPSTEGIESLTLTPTNREGSQIIVEPWPFKAEVLTLRCEGRHLLNQYADQEQMRAALKAAAPVTLVFELIQAGSTVTAPEGLL